MSGGDYPERRRPTTWLVVGLAAACAAAVPVRAAVIERVDLAGTFPGPATRDQGPTGSCHVFSTVALVESALFRRYGVHFALSEADLFVGKVLGDPYYYASVKKAVGSYDGSALVWRFLEGGNATEDIAFVQRRGIVGAKTEPWDAFERRYRAFRDSKRPVLEARAAPVIATAGAQDQLRDDWAALDRAVSSGYMDHFGLVRAQQLRTVEFKIMGAALAAKKDFYAFLDAAAAKDEAQAEKLLLGSPAITLALERGRLKRLVAAFRPERKDFSYPSTTDRGDAARCSALGLEQRKAALAYLRRGIPVAFAMDIEGIPAWTSSTTKDRAWHEFTVVGFERDEKGRVAFQSRNSWGGDNPVVTQAQLCRVRRVFAFLTDKE